MRRADRFTRSGNDHAGIERGHSKVMVTPTPEIPLDALYIYE